MLRKFTLALAASAALGAAALPPTTASAHGWHGGHGDTVGATLMAWDLVSAPSM